MQTHIQPILALRITSKFNAYLYQCQKTILSVVIALKPYLFIFTYFYLNYSKDILDSDLSSKLVESIVNEKFCTMGQIAVSIGSRDSTEYNSRRWSFTVRMVVVLRLVNSYNSLKRHQYQNNDVVLSKHNMDCSELLLVIPVTVRS